MYRILKQINNTGNVWAFHTQDGAIWTTDNLDEAIAEVRRLLDIAPALSTRLVQQVDLDIVLTAPPEEPVPEPEPEP